MKRHQHPLIDRLFQRNLIRHIVIADLINIFAVHPFRRGSKPQQKLRLKIIDDPSVLIVYRMMEFIDHQIIKIIRCKIRIRQIFLPAQCRHRGKNHRLIRILPFPIKETIILRAPHIPERYRRLP